MSRDPRALLRHPLTWLLTLALVVRIGAMVGRGDYVAYDEAWYLILGRNLLEGRGYTLAGLRHVTLSPLFPIVAGFVDALIGNAVLAGRIIAVISGAALVAPCWFLFQRLAGARVALLACLFVALLPSLAPYAAPRWVGWDLWVGAEPLFHVLLFCALACFARGLEQERGRALPAAGALLALAYLTRAEGVIVFVLLVACALVIAALRRSARTLAGVALMALAFGIVAAPYWLYLHDTLGRWTLTGRGVQVSASVGRVEGERPARAAGVIERMLWQRDYTYAEALYALHPSGTRMASDYWGVPDATADVAPAPLPPPLPRDSAHATSAATADTAEQAAGGSPAAPQELPGPVALYARALGLIVPLYLWPLIAIGLLWRARRMRAAEAAMLASLSGSALAIAGAVAVDPRTQLLLLPLLCFYSAAGVVALEAAAARLPRVRPAVLGNAVALGLAALMLLETGRRTWFGATLATEVQVMGTEFRLLGAGLRGIVPPGQRIVSWHPAVALHARRDWNPLPLATAPDVLRYARAVDARYVVFGGHNPSALRARDLPREYLVLTLGDEPAGAERIEFVALTPLFAVGRLAQ